MLKSNPILSVFAFMALLTLASVSSYGQKPKPGAPTPTDVSVVKTTTVVVGNTTDNPVAVRNVEPAREPYQVGGTIQGQCPLNQFVAQRSFTIPQGKRFVIEHASFRTFLGTLLVGEGIWIEVTTTFNGQIRLRSLDFNRQTMGGQINFMVANHPMLAYADGGTDVVVTAVLSNPPSCSSYSSLVANGVLTGYLVDIP